MAIPAGLVLLVLVLAPTSGQSSSPLGTYSTAPAVALRTENSEFYLLCDNGLTGMTGAMSSTGPGALERFALAVVDEGRITLRNIHHDKYIGVDDEGNVLCSATTANSWEYFTVGYPGTDGGSAAEGVVITLYSHHNTYVSTDSSFLSIGVSSTAEGESASLARWRLFALTAHPPSPPASPAAPPAILPFLSVHAVSLRSVATGLYLHCNGSNVGAGAAHGDLMRFELGTTDDGRIELKNVERSKYIGVDWSGNVLCHSGSAGGWERFTPVYTPSGSGGVADSGGGGVEIVLRSTHNNYLSCTDGGDVGVTDGAIGPHERWIILAAQYPPPTPPAAPPAIAHFLYKPIALRNEGFGRYLHCVDSQGHVTLNTSRLTPHTSHLRYLHCLDGAGLSEPGSASESEARLGLDERFELSASSESGKVALRSIERGRYIGVDSSGNVLCSASSVHA